MITTVVVSSNRTALLKKCLTSLRSEKTDVFVLLNGESENRGSLNLCAELNVKFHVVREKVSPAEARNIAIKFITTPWIHFLDDDASVFDGFYTLANQTVENSSADVIGGPNLTPTDSGFFSHVSGLVLESFWGAGPCHKRYSTKKTTGFCDESSFILCNLLVRTSTFKNTIFPPQYYCGEENALLAEMKKSGSSFYFDSRLFAWHERRSYMGQYLQQIWKYGVGRGQNILNLFSFRVHHLIPAVSLVTLLLSLFSSSPNILVRVLMWFYFAGTVIAAGRGINGLPNSERLKAFGLLLFLYPMTHLAYAIGTFSGIIFLGNVFQTGPAFFKALKPFRK